MQFMKCRASQPSWSPGHHLASAAAVPALPVSNKKLTGGSTLQAIERRVGICTASDRKVGGDLYCKH